MIVWFVVQRLDWTYAINARAIQQALPRYEIRIIERDPPAGPDDVVLDFWWNGGIHHPRLIRQVSSHRWTHIRYGRLDATALAERHLADARVVTVPSVRLERLLSPLHSCVVRTPKGFDPSVFHDRGARAGPLSIGWAGALKPDKGFRILKRAEPHLRMACSLPYADMPDWYRGVDVITCASVAEGDPRPLIEGMACGCFPVCTDVGIVPELVRHGDNGLIVERSTRAFAEAFAWCRDNVERVRAAGRRNAEEMLASRTWAQVAPQWAEAIEAAR